MSRKHIERYISLIKKYMNNEIDEQTFEKSYKAARRLELEENNAEYASDAEYSIFGDLFWAYDRYEPNPEIRCDDMIDEVQYGEYIKEAYQKLLRMGLV